MMHEGWPLGMGWAHLAAVLLTVLIIAALIKYLFFR
jgi:hypothetical protein